MTHPMYDTYAYKIVFRNWLWGADLVDFRPHAVEKLPLENGT